MAKSKENLSPGGYAGRRGEKKSTKGPYRRKRALDSDAFHGVKRPLFGGELGTMTGSAGKKAQAEREKRNAEIEAEIRKKMKKKK